MSKPTWPLSPRPSSRAFTLAARQTPGFTVVDWLHGYVYARWPYLYISIAVGEHPLARLLKPVIGAVSRLVRVRSERTSASPEVDAPVPRHTFADTYHGKVMTLEAATRLVQVQQEITLTDLEQVIPYATARDIVLSHPDHVVVMDCPCRVARPDPCLPVDVCLIVGEPFASFVSEHHPQRSRWITPHEAVVILQQTQERGHVSHAFFKDAMLGRFYAICNCCSCCCGAMQAHQHGTPMLASSGYVAVVDSARCTGCGVCTEYCQFSAIVLGNGAATVDVSQCMGCGVCLSKCQADAVSLMRDASKGEPLEIQELLGRAAAHVAMDA